eukprot:scaffold8620_cov62-Phaeocystis_antarctica.AAC.15
MLRRPGWLRWRFLEVILQQDTSLFGVLITVAVALAVAPLLLAPVSECTHALPVASSYKHRPSARKSQTLIAASGEDEKTKGQPDPPDTSCTALMPPVESSSFPSRVCVGLRLRTSQILTVPSEQPEASMPGRSRGAAERLPTCRM